MEQDKPVHTGILLFPPHVKILIKKTWQPKFCQLFKASKFGIQRLEIYDSADETNVTKCSRIITLENCIKITQKGDTSFSLITKTANYNIVTASNQALLDWLVALQTVAFGDDVSQVTSIEEDNELYCSSGEAFFIVKLHPSSASYKCGLEPQNYSLVLTASAIQLRNEDDNKLLYTWPYRFIRRYGYKEGKFMFEAGRKCESGEGEFHLEHFKQQEIYRCLASKMKAMKKLLNAESTNSLLDCGDNQFQAALGMEARSRSPLPPSPTTSTSLQDMESHNSSKSCNLIDFSFDKKISPVTSINKPKPLKPPRKTIPIKSDKQQNYEPVDKYDQVEYRVDAWRTLGTDDIKHTENIREEMGDHIPRSQKLDTQDQKLPETSKIITQFQSEDDSYDRLNFFGSCSKLSTTKAGYKQVTPAPVLPLPYIPCFNDYDEVQPTMESVRIADDSHLGYALVRKPLRDPVDHQFHNDDPYAVISKAKHV